MANTLVTSSIVLREVAFSFLNKVKFVANCNRTYDDAYRQNGAVVGNTVQARLPQRFTVSDGQGYQAQNLLNQTVPITLTNQKHVDFGWSSAERTTELQDIKRNYVQPAAQALANAADVLAYNAVYRDVYNVTGTLGTTPSAALTYLQGRVKMLDQAVDGPFVAVLDTLAMATLNNAISTLFHPVGALSSTWREGMMAANQLGVAEWYEDQNRSLHTSGTFTASTPLVDGASQTGSTINIDGWASGASTLNKGDILTMAGVYSVNPVSYVSTGRLQQFVVTATTSDVAGAMATLPISPSIITSGSLQTVSVSPVNNAVVTVWSANPAGGVLATTVSPQSMIYTKDAFAFVMADLVKPNAGASATSVSDKEFGIAIRYVEQYIGTSDQNLNRLDILIGAATIRAGAATRVVG